MTPSVLQAKQTKFIISVIISCINNGCKKEQWIAPQESGTSSATQHIRWAHFYSLRICYLAESAPYFLSLTSLRFNGLISL